MSYKRIGAPDRLQRPLVRGELGVPEAVAYEDAVSAAAQRLARLRDAKGAGVIAGVASPHATNEDLFVFRRLLDALGVETAGVAVPTGRSDDKLIHAEKAANAAGARALGFGDASAVCDRIRSGAVDGLIVLGHDLLDTLGGAQALSALDTVVALDPYASDLQRVAHVLLPTRVAAEKHGSLTNCDGRVQKVVPAVEAAFDARTEGAALAALGAALALPGFDGRFDAFEVSKSMAESVPAFAGAALDALGEQGVKPDGSGGDAG